MPKTTTAQPAANADLVLRTEPMTLRVSAGDYNKRPQITIETAERDRRGSRLMAARMHAVAAAVEYALSDTNERWLVQTQRTADYTAAVRLELMDETPAEVERAMAVLRMVAAAWAAR